MQETKVKGIVLGAIDFKEKDKLLSVFTLEEGLLSVVLKGVKSANAKNKFAKEPFCFADFILQGSGDFRLATEIGIIDSFYDITKNLDNFYAGSIVLNVVKCVVKNGNSNEPLFVEVLKALKGLCYDNLNPKLVLILFLNKIISGFGYRLNLDKCSTCAAPFVSKRFLNVDNGDIVCFSCKDRHAVEISAGCHSIFRVLSGCDYCKLSTVSFPETCVLEALKMLEIIFEQHFSKKLSFMF